jgi:hypothetical protein
MKYQGSCHCGAVAYQVEGDIQGAIMCNCSICHKRGGPLWFVGRNQLRFDKGEDSLAAYTFNKHVIKHFFCSRCGIHTHGAANDPKGNPVAAINLRCLDGVDLDQLEITPYDGRSK